MKNHVDEARRSRSLPSRTAPRERVSFGGWVFVAGLLLAASPVHAAEDAQTFVATVKKTLTDPWVIFGFAAQSMFMMRFVIQWIASERRRRSHVPLAFWYFSLAGGVMLLSYAIRRQDPVFMFGQALGCFIYIRNLILIYRRRLVAARHRKARRARQASLVDRLLEDDGLEEQEPEAEPEPVLVARPSEGRAS